MIDDCGAISTARRLEAGGVRSNVSRGHSTEDRRPPRELTVSVDRI
jgi:hypothetical protein